MYVVLKYISFKTGLFVPGMLMIFLDDKKSSCLFAEHDAEIISKENLVIHSKYTTEE